uniref:Uncharacterized protein n=1 Tax=Megaselia scalaris TaxID=36166 RepID=T1GF82_MEGSC
MDRVIIGKLFTAFSEIVIEVIKFTDLEESTKNILSDNIASICDIYALFYILKCVFEQIRNCVGQGNFHGACNIAHPILIKNKPKTDSKSETTQSQIKHVLCDIRHGTNILDSTPTSF